MKNYSVPISKIAKELKFTMSGTTEPPKNLIWFLTEKCNCLCTFCFVNNVGRKHREEWSTQEIQNFIVKNKTSLGHINLTGGEVMIRPDIETILTTLHENDISTSISTNGFQYEKLVSIIKRFYPGKVTNFRLQTSLDGPEEIHNKIRRFPQAYQNAIGLIKSAKTNGIPITAVVTISKENYPHLDYVVDIAEKYQIPLLMNIVRSAEDTKSSEKNDFVPVEKNDLSLEEIEQAITKWKVVARKYMPYSGYITNLARMRTVTEFITKAKWSYPCTAGMSLAVMHSNGEVSVCEMLKPLGNIKDFGMDWCKFWEKKRQGKKVCFCQYDCAMLDSLTKSLEGWRYLVWQMIESR